MTGNIAIGGHGDVVFSVRSLFDGQDDLIRASPKVYVHLYDPLGGDIDSRAQQCARGDASHYVSMHSRQDALNEAAPLCPPFTDSRRPPVSAILDLSRARG